MILVQYVNTEHMGLNDNNQTLNQIRHDVTKIKISTVLGLDNATKIFRGRCICLEIDICPKTF